MDVRFYMQATEKDEVIGFKNNTTDDQIKDAFLDWVDSHIVCGYDKVKNDKGPKIINFAEKAKEIKGRRKE